MRKKRNTYSPRTFLGPPPPQFCLGGTGLLGPSSFPPGSSLISPPPPIGPSFLSLLIPVVLLLSGSSFSCHCLFPLIPSWPHHSCPIAVVAVVVVVVIAIIPTFSVIVVIWSLDLVDLTAIVLIVLITLVTLAVPLFLWSSLL
jgi:hypothetical protein